MTSLGHGVAILLLLLGSIQVSHAGGSGLNVMVVVNQNSTNSIQLGNYYCERRGVPPQNLVRVDWSGGNTSWTRTQFETVLRLPLQNALAARRLTNQIDYVVLCMDLPYQVIESTGNPITSGINSTTAALYYGFHADGCSGDCPAGLPSCNLPGETTNRYAGSEGIFRQTPPVSMSSNAWLTFLLTATNLSQAMAVVDRGVVSDFSFPTQKVFLTKSYDGVRNLRYLQANDVILNTRIRGNSTVVLTNTSTTSGLGPMAGFQNGVQVFSIDNLGVASGAMMDNLTSYGGLLFNFNEHTTALDFIHSGATASYGTVVEPCAYAEKFPAAQNYFYQARGFSIGECYYQSLTNPFQGILVGEPMAAPYALPANGNWATLPEGAVLAGVTNLTALFNSASIARPLQQADLFLDGRWLSTVSNIPPQLNNVVFALISNTVMVSYTVPANATVQSVANGFAAQFNAVSNTTKIAAFAHGDRIELQNLNRNASGSNIVITAGSNPGASGVRTTFVTASRTNFVDTPAAGLREFAVLGQVVIGDYLSLSVTRTNGIGTIVSVTNQTPSSGNLLTDMQVFAQALLAAINSNPALNGPDGIVAEDLMVGSNGVDPVAQFNLRARSIGWREAQIQAHLTGSFTLFPSVSGRLEDNLNDLRPRNHVYVTAGATNWNLTFPFNSTTNADGHHELTVVAYEGSHVRTQTRISRNIQIQNNGWTATLAPLLGGTNTALEATMQFLVTANTNNITAIELFSTGGSLGVSNGVASATFAIPASYLGIGLHPIYALVTRNDGKQYRTQTFWTRIVGPEPPFTVEVTEPLPTLTWPASAGRNYQILSTADLTSPFILQASVTPTNSMGRWSGSGGLGGQRFYRIKTP